MVGEDLHLAEAGGADGGQVVAPQERAGDAGGVKTVRLAQIGRKRPLKDDVRDDHPPAGLEDAVHLAEDLRLVRREVDDAVGDDHVHRAVLDRQLLDQTLAELHVAQAGGLAELSGVPAGQSQHLRRHVHADGPAFGAHLLRGQEHVLSGAAAQVEHDVAFLQARECNRVAARQAEFRLRDRMVRHRIGGLVAA